MEKERKHTPIPWEADVNGIFADNEKGTSIAHEIYRTSDKEFIVKACNNHYQLLEALKGLLDKLKDEAKGNVVDIRIKNAEEAIKQAEA